MKYDTTTGEYMQTKQRPDSLGFWWLKKNNKISVGQTKMIDWNNDDENPKMVLAWSSGICWFKCDEINQSVLVGSEWIEAANPFVIKRYSAMQLVETRKKLFPEWSAETKEFVDELYSRLEWAETEVEVFNLRLKGEWTPNSKLYTKKEVDALVAAEYSIGYDEGQSAAFVR